MLKITANLESFLHNKGFTLRPSVGYQHWSKSFDLSMMEILLMDLSDKGDEFGVLVRVTQNGDLKMESTFTLATPLDILHLEAFLNMNLPSNAPFVKDQI